VIIEVDSMKADYVEGQFRELEISGNATEWLAFSMALQQDGTSIPCQPLDNLPEKHVSISSIRVQHFPDQKVKIIYLEKDTVLIAGDPKLLGTFSKSVENFATDFADGTHIHIDYQGDDHFVDLDSICTVLSRP
jgi:hypothetical protein